MAALLASPAGLDALCAALLWPAVTGFPTWPALARGRLASTVGVSAAIGVVVFAFVQRLTAPAMP
jgi:hypothetical protein